jgi:hypothetical protein
MKRGGAYHLRWRQGLADRLGPELRQDRPQRADARRERVLVAFNDVVKLAAESGGFFARQVNVHDPDIG